MSEKDVLLLTPDSIADKANKCLQQLENAVTNKKIKGLLLNDNEVAALLVWVKDLTSEIMSLREHYE